MINKQNLPINFAQGLDTKTDPFQVTPGKFLTLVNSIFTKMGLLQKRNGNAQLPSLPDNSATYATTFNGNLTAIGNNLQAFSAGSRTWVDKGNIIPLGIDTLPLIRNSTNQSQVDTAIAPNGLICTVYTDNVPSAVYKYVVADSVTGQNIVAPTVITPSTGAVAGSPRVFLLGKYFVIVFTNLISATNHLQYIAINSTVPTSVTANVDISSQYTPSSKVNFDGVVANNILYLAWNGSDGGGAIRMRSLSSTLGLSGTISFSGKVATIMSVTADESGSSPVIYASFYNAGSSTGYTLAVSHTLVTILAPVETIASGTILNITSSASAGVCTIVYEVSNAYSYDGGIATNYIESNTITQAGVVGSPAIVIRSLGLASKSFIFNSNIYFLGIYNSTYQPTYFLIELNGNIVAKLAYSNGGVYYVLGLPSVMVNSDTIQVGYLIKDLVQAVNKTQGAANAAGVYSQTGINLATFTFNASIVSTEIGSNLNLTGGFLWMYDGYTPVEQNFHLWPDYIEVATATTGGHLTAQIYYYVVTYEWSDNQGNLFRSAPSIPVIKDISTSMTSTNKNTINVPTLRLTYKIANPVKLVVYRWSTAQQTYYQVTSITSPTLNDPTVDSIAIVDTLADSSIIGNNILYTTGGVVENIGPPACSDVTLYKSRLFLIDAEDKNLLWYSKQVIEATPVEMSDLFTIYVAPTTGAQGSTSILNCIAPMDDKLILFKKDAIYYITGTGPDNTGANNDFSDPVFVTSTVGCANKNSIVFMPEGLMFQSDKGIWLLGRDLSTTYIGAPVEIFNQYVVDSALNIPGTNQVRFSLSNGQTLMYDYFFGQWGVFQGAPAISSTLYEGLHTFINSHGQVFQESPGLYLDGSTPVLMGFTTSWFNLAGLQGFERAYFFYLLGSYISPHKIQLGIAYDYNPSPLQSVLISPDNYNAAYGSDSIYGGGSPYGGNPTLEQWRVFLTTQKCQSFQITMQEVFDSSFGAPAGAGFTLSGLNLVVGMKKAYVPKSASNSIG